MSVAEPNQLDYTHPMITGSEFKRALSRFNIVEAWRRRGSVRVSVGSGLIHSPGWQNTDIDTLNVLERRDWEKQFAPNTIDFIFAEHVWEHLTPEEGLVAAKCCFDFLKPGGHVRLAVPDGHHPRPAYIEAVKPDGLSEGSNDHKILYDHESLSELLEQAGLVPRLLEYFDRTGTFHQSDWDTREGPVRRSAEFDQRNTHEKLFYTSLIVDGVKPS